MPELPQVNAREIGAALGRLGFEYKRQRGGHAIHKHAGTGRRAVVPTHGGRDIAPGTLRAILQEAGITTEEFVAVL